MNGLNEPRILGVVRQRASSQGNYAIESRRCDITMAPDGVQQLLPSQQFARAA